MFNVKSKENLSKNSIEMDINKLTFVLIQIIFSVYLHIPSMDLPRLTIKRNGCTMTF